MMTFFIAYLWSDWRFVICQSVSLYHSQITRFLNICTGSDHRSIKNLTLYNKVTKLLALAPHGADKLRLEGGFISHGSYWCYLVFTSFYFWSAYSFNVIQSDVIPHIEIRWHNNDILFCPYPNICCRRSSTTLIGNWWMAEHPPRGHGGPLQDRQAPQDQQDCRAFRIQAGQGSQIKPDKLHKINKVF